MTRDCPVQRFGAAFGVLCLCIWSEAGAARFDASALSPDEAGTLSEARAIIERVRTGEVTLRVIDGSGAPVANAPITVELKQHAFLFGCNIFGFDEFASDAENEEYKQRFEELFNYATTGFYWKSYEPIRGKPNYAKTDAIVAWCKARGIRVKGHPLLWDHEAAEPVWSDGQPSMDIQQQRVREIVSRYKGAIDYWEVVNEPSHVTGVAIDGPYRWARESDRNAHLIVNDYHVMADGYRPFFELLQNAIDNAIPFDGVGIQAHEPRTMRFPLHRVKATLDTYATLGKSIHITEFTPTSAGAPITGSTIKGNWNEQRQAEYAEQFYTVCFAHPAVAAITWWDLCDAKSWLKGGGLLRDDLSPKPAYDALKRLIREQWHTRERGETDGQGTFSLRGYFGSYRVEVGKDDGMLSAEIRLEEKTRSPMVVTVE
ncbi:MAG: endo-1,4-beta-xylanase [Candidatus Hydrogenedentes bacterium]|nr:endo-1,4-beta-xylanase [Candidatus Hydrogenedentota bacterium]